MPLTTFARQVGTSVQMLDKHYASVIENWDGQLVPAEAQDPGCSRRWWTRSGRASH